MKKLSLLFIVLLLFALSACAAAPSPSGEDSQAAYKLGYESGYSDGYDAGKASGSGGYQRGYLEGYADGRSRNELETSGSSPDYILNTNTKKFHYPECSSVNDISSKNYREFYGSRDEVIDMGYEPCKRCNP